MLRTAKILTSILKNLVAAQKSVQVNQVIEATVDMLPFFPNDRRRQKAFMALDYAYRHRWVDVADGMVSLGKVPAGYRSIKAYRSRQERDYEE